MNMLATITAQGQLTIPIEFRRRLGLGVSTKVLLREEKKQLIIEPVQDIFSAKGMFADRAFKGVGIADVIAREEDAGYEVLKKKYSAKA